MHAISTQIVDDNITRNLTIGVSRKLKFKPFGEELGHELPSVATGEDLYTLKIIMPLKSIFQDMKGGIGSISKRNFEVKFHRSRSQSALDDSHYKNNNKNNKNHGVLQESLWGNMPPELLRDVIQRIEGSESSWPCRKHVVACAGVCRTWRQITKELVKTPEISEKLTFPISLKQPGSRDSPVQCFIKRDRATSTYQLYLSLTPSKFVIICLQYDGLAPARSLCR